MEHLSDVLHFLDGTCMTHPEISIECLSALFLARAAGDPVGNDREIKHILTSLLKILGWIKHETLLLRTRGRTD